MRKVNDLTGKVFGRWTVIKRADNEKGRVKWLCRCTCANEKVVSGNNLTMGKSKSCGCATKESVSNMQKTRNNKMLNKRFGKLIVTERARIKDNGHQLWICKCDCGNEKITTTDILNQGRLSSCGCLRSEKVKINFQKYEEQRIDGVIVPSLKQKKPKNNTTGHKGVSIVKEKGNIYYRAYINLNKKRKWLGYYKNLEDAVKAREEAEIKYYHPLIEAFKEK